MNNKLFARIMTAVICICMMSTVCFAAAPELVDGDDATTKKINFVDGTSNWLAAEGTADQVTMMAYLVPAGTAIDDAAYVDETNTPMIAIDQYDGDALATTVSVLASKLVEGKDIVLQKGDSNGNGAKIVVAKEEIGGETVITVINGAASIEVTADADGNVTLPTTAEFGKTSPAGYTFTLYSWVTEDGTKEYKVADAPKVAATELEGVTLYAKFASDKVKGDVNGDGVVNTGDFSPILFAYKGNTNAMFNKNAGKAIYEGSTILKGDVNGDGVVNTGDFSPVLFVYKGNTNAMFTKNANLPYYVVNK